MTITNKAASKLVVAFVAAAMLMTLAFAPTAKAATEAELQAQITALMAQIAALQGQTSGGATASMSYTFTRDLTMGSTGEDVMHLQKFLNSNGYTVAMTGAGSVGMETTYFGGLTKAALAKYQAAKGIAPAVGYFGPLTRAAVHAQMAMMPPTTPGSPDGGGDDGDDDNDNGDLSGGAGDITVTSRSSGTEDEVIEAEEDVPVVGFDVEADGSDVAITSVRVEFEHEGAGSDQLDRYVDEVSIWMGDEEVGRADVDDFSESSDIFSNNIAVSGAVVDEDDEVRFYVAVTAANNVDSDDLSQIWEGGVGQIRFKDGTGATLTDGTGTGVTAGTGNGSIAEEFTFEDLSSSGDVELRVSEDDDDVNEPHSVAVDDTDDTNDVDLLSFTLDAEGSDISVDTLSIAVTATSSTGATGGLTGVTEIANDFRLMMEDEEVGTVSIDQNCDGTGGDSFASSTDNAICVLVTDLDDDDVTIEDGDEATFMLVADINDVELGFASGDKLSATLTGDATASDNGHVDADDENGDALAASELSGSADSTDVEFLSSGISVATVSVNNPTQNVNVESSATDNTGLFEITFDVTAIEDDAFIELGSATRGTTESNTGANFIIQDEPNSYAATTTGAISLADLTSVSGGSTSGNFVKVSAGQTARFKLAVTFDPGHVTGSSVGYRMNLYSVNSAATAVDATAQQVLTPEADYRTGATTIGN